MLVRGAIIVSRMSRGAFISVFLNGPSVLSASQ
jgi:hypothetical protein